jgi:hypothetical protein
MRKRRKALVWTFVGLLIATVAFFISTQLQPRPDNQPVYKGRALAQWLSVAARRGDVNRGNTTLQQIDVAEDAIRAIGTNAFPFLLEWTRYKPSSAKRFFFFVFDETPMPGIVRGPLWGLSHRREMLAEQAVHGFRVLCTNAFAFETLSKLATDTNHSLAQLPAAKAILLITNTPAQ